MDKFIIYLTIYGTSHEDVEFVIANPAQPLRELIQSIVKEFKLPRVDNAYNPILYLLCIDGDKQRDETTLDFEDENGKEMTLLDYHIRSGSRLNILSVPIASGLPQIKMTCGPKRRGFFDRIFNRHSDWVFSSLFAPDKVQKESGMMVQVYLYNDGERDIVCREATRCDAKTIEKAYTPLHFKVRNDDTIDIKLNIHGIDVDRDHKSIVWQGLYTKVSFYVEVPETWKHDHLWGEVLLSANGILLGELDFQTSVVDDSQSVQQQTAEVVTRQYKRIFISYAHQDSKRVQDFALAYKAQGVDYFFDRHKLKAGDVYDEKIFGYIDRADLFILVWSDHAAKSAYVAKERRRAMTHAYPQLSHQAATLKIYPISIEPRAALPQDMAEIYNFEEA